MFAPTHPPGQLHGRDWRDPSEWLVWEYLERRRRSAPDAPAASFDGRAITFGQLAAQAEALAAGLQQRGVGPGDVVSYQLPNWPEATLIMLAALRLGAMANPIVPIYRRHEVEFILRQTRSKVIFTSSQYRGFDYGAMARAIAEADTRVEIVLCRTAMAPSSFAELLQAAPKTLARIHSDPDCDAFLLYTSGTEGDPKGVRHSQRTLIADTHSIIASTAITMEDRFYLATPLTHITGLLYGQLTPIVAGIEACIADGWNPEAAASLIEERRCTLMCGATPFLRGMIEQAKAQPQRLRSLRAFRCGGAETPASLIRVAHELGIFALRTYGCTEHPTVTGDVRDHLAIAAETDGRIQPYCEVRIAPDEAAGQEGTGEIQTRGPELFLGYMDPSLDEAAFTDDGWFRTGDLGFLSTDGVVTVVGRKKDIIIRKGENVSAREIEQLLLTHGAVRAAAVVGAPDEERGEMVVAFCVLANDADCAPRDLIAHLTAAGLARQKIPERVEILEEMPMTAAGKIRKSELRSRLARSEN